jgi:hypothetical protein
LVTAVLSESIRAVAWGSVQIFVVPGACVARTVATGVRAPEVGRGTRPVDVTAGKKVGGRPRGVGVGDVSSAEEHAVIATASRRMMDRNIETGLMFIVLSLKLIISLSMVTKSRRYRRLGGSWVGWDYPSAKATTMMC